MIKDDFKRAIKYLLDLSGYRLLNKEQFGNDILVDIKTILKTDTKLTMFDIGANLGQTSLELAETFPKSAIYSFEPDPDTYAKLSVETKSHEEIKVFNIGFGHEEAKVQMNINKGSGGNSILSVSHKINEFASGGWTESIGQREVDITTLNSFCKINDIQRIDLLKIDTQGYEIRILEGGDKIITPSFTKVIFIEVLFIELYKEQAYFMDIYEILTERGFKLVGLYNKFHKVDSPHFLLWCDALFVSNTL